MLDELLEAPLERLRTEHRFRSCQVSTGISVSDNDYLGLSSHPRLVTAGKRALEIFGAGSRGSRLLGGHSRQFEEVEAEIASFFGAPSALFFSSGYLANLAVVTALGKVAGSLVCDEKIHASLIDGARLAALPKTIVPHNRWEQVARGQAVAPPLFLAESLYSMDGDFGRLDTLRDAVEASGGICVLDEAHAAGVFPADGAGLGWKDWSRLAVVVTFGKAFGVGGAAVIGSERLRDWLVNAARSFIYTTAPSPVVAAMVVEALRVVREEKWRREELWDRAREVRRVLSDLPGQRSLASGTPWDDASPIIPFLIPGEDSALRFCESMGKKGVYLRAIRYPTVPRGTERVRISLNLNISRENTLAIAQELKSAWMAFSS